MSSKIEVSRELLGQFAAYASDSASAVMRARAVEVRALLAAPVVERQPDAIIEGVMTSVGITHAIYASTAPLKDKEQVKLYTVPPELAELQANNENLRERISKRLIDLTNMRNERDELQATIARLTAEVAEWKDTVKFNETCWSKERGTIIDNLQVARAEIERLKGGQLEPVAWMLDGSVGGSSLDFQKTDLLDTQNRYGGCLIPLFTSQPAPVSVALPPYRTENNHEPHSLEWHSQNDCNEEWNACLDKVKELNK